MEALGLGLGPVPIIGEWEVIPDRPACGDARCWQLLGGDYNGRCCLHTSLGMGSVRIFPGNEACWHGNFSFASCCGDPLHADRCSGHPTSAVGAWALGSEWPISADVLWREFDRMGFDSLFGFATIAENSGWKNSMQERLTRFGMTHTMVETFVEMMIRVSISMRNTSTKIERRALLPEETRAHIISQPRFYDVILLRDLLWNEVLDLEAWSDYARVEDLSMWIALQPECLWRSAVQRRAELLIGVVQGVTTPTCAEFQISKAVQHLKVSGRGEAAQELFQEALRLRLPSRWPLRGWPDYGNDAPLLRWDQDLPEQTPQKWIQGLSSQKWWTREASLQPLVQTLEKAFAGIQNDLVRSMSTQENQQLMGSRSTDAYADFKRKSTWVSFKIYDCYEGWLDASCDLFPSICSALKGKSLLPSETWPELCSMGFWETVQLLAVRPFTDVPLHSTTNSMVNVQLGLTGLEGVTLHIGNENVSWHEGTVIAWLDSFEHAVTHIGNHTRWVLTVQTLRPELRGTGGVASHAGGLGAKGLLFTAAAAPAMLIEGREERLSRMMTFIRMKLELLWQAGGVLKELVFTY